MASNALQRQTLHAAYATTPSLSMLIGPVIGNLTTLRRTMQRHASGNAISYLRCYLQHQTMRLLQSNVFVDTGDICTNLAHSKSHHGIHDSFPLSKGSVACVKFARRGSACSAHAIALTIQFALRAKRRPRSCVLSLFITISLQVCAQTRARLRQSA